MSSPAFCGSTSKYVVTFVVEKPKAIAIVLGHLGISSDELQCLSKLYLDRDCAVVAAQSPPLDFLLAQHGRLKPVTHAILKETESLSRHYNNNLAMHNDGRKEFGSTMKQSLNFNNIPMLVHMWSNGGAFLWEEMINDSNNSFDRIVRPNLQYVAYDSCPCYLHLPWLLGPFWNDAFPFPGWPSWARKLYLVAASLSLNAWCLITGSLQRPLEFWDRMRDPPCRHLLYLYSTNDKVTDSSRIDQLIHEQRTIYDKQVTTVRFEDSEHCRLSRDHPQDYGMAIDEALRAAIERATKSA